MIAVGARLVLVLVVFIGGGCPDKRSPKPGPGVDASKGPPTLPQKGPLAQRMLYEQGKSLLRAGRYQQAVKTFRRAIAADPKGKGAANCYLGLGSALGELRRYKEAVEAYHKVVALRPDDPEAYRALAIGQEDAKMLEEAQQSLEQALALDGDQLSAYQDLARLYLERKEMEGAKRVYLRYELRRTALIKALGLSKSEDRRVEAALALGEARDEATTKALGLALTDRSHRVRMAVIRALGRQGLSQGEGPLRRLLESTKDPDERRAIQISLKAIADTPQPGPQPIPTPVAPDAGSSKATTSTTKTP
jgi:tetratricopeptide (TPR) repeat protein